MQEEQKIVSLSWRCGGSGFSFETLFRREWLRRNLLALRNKHLTILK